MQPRVFISHSTKDKVVADSICHQLESQDIKCWIAPRDIEAGSSWTEGILHGIDACRVLILVFSEHANSSDHVYREVAKAFSSGLAVIPFRVKEVLPNHRLSYFLDTVQWLDAIQPPLQRHLVTLTERVKTLLAGKNQQQIMNPTELGPGTSVRSGLKNASSAGVKRRNRVNRIALAAVCLAIGTALWLSTVSTRKARAPGANLSAIEVRAKSIAVLPFESLSASKEDTYFADGVQDEVLNNLAKIAQLKVISRTSVMQYRPEAKRDLRQIASALGVAHVLEGTVRRDGKRVRVSAQLVDARNDNTVWADSYDRDLTDIFAIQSEVAQTIAGKLTATLSADEKKRIEAKPTDNLEAYDLYLQAKEIMVRARVTTSFGNVEKPLLDAIDLLDKAAQLDPKFTLAYCLSTEAHDLFYISYDPTSGRRALSDSAIANALRLQPDLPEVHLAYATHLYRAYRDYERARTQLAIARKGLPGDADAIVLEAYMDRRQGNFEKAIQEMTQSSTLDPRNPLPMKSLANLFFLTRQFSAAEQAYNRAIELSPDQPLLRVEKELEVAYQKSANVSAPSSEIAALPTSLENDRGVLTWRLSLALAQRDWQQTRELIERMKGSEDGQDEGGFTYATFPVPIDCYSILIARLQGKSPDTDPSWAQAREQLNQTVQKLPTRADPLSTLAVVDALLGKKFDAITEAKRAAQMLPIAKDAVAGPCILLNLAVVYAWTDELDEAFAILDPLAKTPNGIYYGDLKLDPYWEPLRTDPRYQKLLADLAPRD
jgi:TolB-like protein/Tfp pilus assembly protein PilF